MNRLQRHRCPTQRGTSPAHGGQSRAVVPRRIGTSAEIPDVLVRYREDDWVGPANVLEWPTTREDDRPHIRWASARRKWARDHIRTEADFDRLLYGPDVEFPPETDPRIDRDLTCILGGHYEWRRADGVRVTAASS
jgi:hypothetical protein